MGGNGPIRRTVRIVNPLGFHQRPATAFALTAKTFASRVTVYHGDTRADGKNLIDLILLVALPESEVVLEVDGPDAADAVEPLVSILAAAGDDEGPATLRLARK
jgi:phosphotransferase system HPr (HPr) family protein